MLARLQQLITLGLLLTAAVWLAVFIRAGHPWWALAGAMLLLTGHAAVLALEMVLMRCVHGADPTPPPRIGVLVRAWLGEAVAAPVVFCWRQPFRSRRWPDHLRPAAQGRRGVVLVHGFVCNRGLWNPWLARLTAQGTPFVAVNLEPVFGAIDEYAAPIEAAVLRIEQATGLPPVIVAHSMGGLALRCWWIGHGRNERVHRAITIGTPHGGTWLARWGVTANARQMRLSSPWLAELARREPAGSSARFTCFYGHCDNIVFPPRSAMLPLADNRLLAGVAHVHMVDRPEPFEELQRWLQASA